MVEPRQRPDTRQLLQVNSAPLYMEKWRQSLQGVLEDLGFAIEIEYPISMNNAAVFSPIVHSSECMCRCIARMLITLCQNFLRQCLELSLHPIGVLLKKGSVLKMPRKGIKRPMPNLAAW